MYAVKEETPRWQAYELRKADIFGYETVRYGVREAYADGATRHVHNEDFATREEAEQLAARFHLNARKGMTYDNVMKRWN
ncbi:hypothetical protein DCC79_06255 [bacterium]|nr:hypothetical protein [Chloroflexi bacterium CFX6]RIL10989.1 MAG: hypothetical protein DCC79_06255 [bacterium]